MSGFIVVKNYLNFNYSEKLEVGTIITFRSQTVACFLQRFSKMHHYLYRESQFHCSLNSPYY